MFLKYSQCFVLLILYSPVLHHVVKPRGSRKSRAYAYGCKCVDAAIEAVCIAGRLEDQRMLHEAYPLIVDVLVMAATVLLVVELGAPDNSMADRVRESNREAKTLLETLARRNRSAAGSLESLKVSPPCREGLVEILSFVADKSAQPVYKSADRASRSSSLSAEQFRPGDNSSPEAHSDIMVWESPFDANGVVSQLDPVNFDLMVTNLLDDAFEPSVFPCEWSPGWNHDDYGNSMFPSVPIDY
jgi:hypothetical protein